MHLTKTMATVLLLVCLSILPGARPALTQEQKPAKCLRFGDCEVITCNPDGSYTYTFQVTNVSAVPATQADFVDINPPGAIITPSSYPLSPPLLPGQSKQVTVTITGVNQGSLCFGLSIHDEKKRNCCTADNKCITLPTCGTASTNECADGVCCARAPQYKNTSFVGQKVAAVTGWNPNSSTNNVLTVFDISAAGGFGVNVNNTPPQYNGPPSSPWTMANLGTIFGVTLDHMGNIYVTASSAYSADFYPPPSGGAGRIYKINNGTGAITTFSTLPNTPASGVYPALGNISFDCPRKQFYVTNEDDGRIYRLNYSGAVVSTFDHATGVITSNGNPEVGDLPGFAPLGERLWAVQAHNNRVFYSVVSEECGNRNPNPAVKNEIWSIGLNVNGDFIPGDKRLELTVPDLVGGDFSNPVSDISFARDGSMLLAERTMSDATNPNAHASRVLEYACTPSGWKLTSPVPGLPYKYNVGLGNVTAGCSISGTAQPANAAGGIDYDFDPAAVFGMWATGDFLKGSPLIYGLQGFPFAGGSVTNSPLVALYGLGSFKTQIGDVEVSCPPGSPAY